MNSLLLAIALALAVRSLASSRLERWNLGAPLVMVLAGVVVGLLNSNSISLALNTEAVQHAAEFILAVLLFVDATEIREGRLWGRSPGLVARLLFLAMPLSLALAMLTGWAEHVPQPRHPRPSRTRRTYYRRLSRDLRRLPRTHRHP